MFADMFGSTAAELLHSRLADTVVSAPVVGYALTFQPDWRHRTDVTLQLAAASVQLICVGCCLCCIGSAPSSPAAATAAIAAEGWPYGSIS
jgi:hypothetical protein